MNSRPAGARAVAGGSHLRLLAVSDAVYPWNHGGKEVRQHELWKRLAARGVRVDVCTMHWWDGPTTISRDGITYHAVCRRVPLYSGARRSVRQALAFAWSLRRLPHLPADVVEVDALPYLHMPVIRLVTRARGLPLVATWHEFWGRDYWREYLGPAGIVAAGVERAAAAMSDVVVAASALTAERLTAHRSPATVSVVENGVDATAVAEARTESGPGTDTDVASGPAEMVAVGRLLAHKRVDAAIAALPLMRHSESRLAVIGVGPEENRLRGLADSLGVTSRVEFVGALDDHVSVLRRIREARVLMFPSEREGFGMVAAEAITVGTPVVTTDAVHNAARLLVTEGVDGTVCAPGPAALAAAADHWWDRKAELMSRVRPGRWDWDELADTLHDVLATVASWQCPTMRGAR